MNNKQISGIGTGVTIAIVVAILMAFGYDPPNPPIAEQGVEVNVGNSDFGFGDDAEPKSTASSYAPPTAQERVATQSTDETPEMNASKSTTGITNPHATEQPTVENKEPEINRNALFTGRRNRDNADGSQGASSGSGNQGKAEGTQSSNNYIGEGGGNGSFSLKGRSAVSLPKPTYDNNRQGRIVIDIWVNQKGEVVRVEGPAQGSTITATEMVEGAKAAARKARFNPDTKALEEQKGSITYIFKI